MCVQKEIKNGEICQNYWNFIFPKISQQTMYVVLKLIVPGKIWISYVAVQQAN